MDTHAKHTTQGRTDGNSLSRLKVLALLAGLTLPSDPLRANLQEPPTAASKSDGVPLSQKSAQPTNVLDISGLREKVAKGDPQAMHTLGLALRNGQSVSPNPTAAQELFLKAARLGHAPSQTEYGKMLLSGEGFKQPDRGSARHWLQTAAAQGEVEGIRILARMLRHGTDGERDIPQALALLERAAKLGCVRSKLQLASFHRELNKKDDAFKLIKECAEKGDVDAQSDLAAWLVGDNKQQEALPWLKKAAAQGDATSMLTLSELYLSGEILPKDLKEGERLLKEAVATGSAIAQLAYASALLPGGALPARPQEAEQLLRGVAKRDLAMAQFMLAQCYLEGVPDASQPITRNPHEGTLWLRQAVTQGYAPAQESLAHILLPGAKTAAEHAEVNTFLKNAADNGFAMSQMSYSERLRQGNGVPANALEAGRYLDLAVKQGLPHALGLKGLRLVESGGDNERKEGLALLKKAAALGEATSQANLGILLTTDEKLRDFAAAFTWTSRAARQGHPQAQYALGLHYENAEGVTQDRAAALMWLRIAADNNVQDALQRVAILSILVGKPTSENAIARARAFRPEPEELHFDQSAVLTTYNDKYLSSRFGPHQILRGDSPLPVMLKLVELQSAKEKLDFARRMLVGEIASPSMASARALLQDAAQHGHTSAMLELGKLLRVGAVGVERNSTDASKWLTKSADAGIAEAQCLIASMHDQGIEIPRNPTLAIEYYRRAAEQGDATALFRVAQFHVDGTHVAPDTVLATNMFRKAAELGHSGAQFELSRLLRKSKAGSSTVQEGLKLLELSAQQGNANAQNELGLAFRDGFAGPKDTAKALRWFEAAASQDLPRGLFNAAILLDLGEGIPADREKAYRYYQRAAEQGLASARYNLALLLQDGSPGAPKNISGALALYEQAAQQGHVKAQYNLGALLMNAEEGTRDLVKAHAWLNIAAANQHPKAAQLRDKVEAHLTPAQRAEAESMTANFMKPARSRSRK
jgi:TPR repeat protein